ncbi:MAG: polysaccharide export protein [Comamonadaceae bacterium]|nr:MAG: polysaccharide export protein [Comamonadaceae bacterium]
MKSFVIRWFVVAFVVVPLFAHAQASRPNSNDAAFSQGIQRNAAENQPAAGRRGSDMNSVPGNNPLNSLAGLGADYKIGANDLIDIEVYGLPELKRTVRVNSSGLVSLALVGNVQLLGLTAQQAEESIAKSYGEKYLQNPQVSVFIREFTTQRVTIEGAVARPGIYPLTGQITLLRAIALAGGGAQFADMTEIVVFRANDKGAQQAALFDLEKIRTGEMPDPAIQAEDVVVVRRDPKRTALRDSIFRDVIDAINPFSVFSR